MLPHKARRGFSPVLIIVIILVLAALGTGGYFAYTNYIEPMMNPYSKLIPAGLKEYAKGKNAEAFIIIKNDQDIKDEILKSSPETAAQANTFEAAIAVVNTTKLSGAIVMLFSTPEKAAELKTLAESQKQTGAVTFTFEQKDKVVIASFGGGLDAMEGPLLDNPAIKKLDPGMMDSQIIAYAAISQMSSLGPMVSNQISRLLNYSEFILPKNASLPVAHAQGLISESDAPSRISPTSASFPSDGLMTILSAASLAPYIDEITIYARYKEQLFDIQAEISLLQKSTISTSPLINSLLKTGTVKLEDVEKGYDKALEMATPITDAIQKLLDEQTKAYPGSTAKMSFVNNRFIFKLNFSKDIAEKQVQGLLGAQLSAPAKGRDAARKANLNMITTAVEAYNLDKGNYPEKSSCVETMDMLKPYLQGGKIPEEVKGYELKMDNCESNYYYQSFSDKGYILWTRMDQPADGNTSMTPADFEKAVAGGNIPSTETSGNYYMVNKSYLQPGTTNVTKLEPDAAGEIPDSMLSEKFSIDAKPVGNNAMGLEIKLAAAPGKTVQGAATITNTSKQSGKVTIFTADKMALRKTEASANKEVGLWTKIDKTEITLASKETQTVNFTVDVPPGTAPGTYQGHLIFAYNSGIDHSTGIRITINVVKTGPKVKRTP